MELGEGERCLPYNFKRFLPYNFKIFKKQILYGKDATFNDERNALTEKVTRVA